MPAAEYTVRLDAFEGPLDLLLFLIRRAEVEITDIPIAMITAQYLRYLDQIALAGPGAVDIEDAGEFLVMAATLMEIKSRMLAPPSVPEHAASETDQPASKPAADPRAELVRQLLEYKRYRDASDQLEHLRRQWSDRFAAGRALAPKAPDPADTESPELKVEIGDLTLVDLVEAFSRIIDTVDMTRVGEHRVVMDDTPVELHAEDIIDRLTRRAREPVLPTHELSIGLSPGEMDFREVFAGRSRSEAIGLFLAVLELVKQQRVGVRQDESGRIVLGLGAAPALAGVSTDQVQHEPGA